MKLAELHKEATVMVDDRAFTGIVHHLWGTAVGSWATVWTPDGTNAGGPVVQWIETDEDYPY